jgi:predicted NAD/FAD-dependent oxidoreductase
MTSDDNKEIYDFIIVGGGIAGLTVTYLLSQSNYKCLLLDDAEELGGCNRCLRQNGMFTEHSPRIITSAYLNYQTILQMLNISFNDIYIPYNFTISNIGGEMFTNLNKKDLFYFVLEFLKLFFNSLNGNDVSVLDFMNQHNMTNNTKDYIDRLCRLTDGAGSDRYSLNTVLQLINQQLVHSIYQPKYSNDYLFSLWEKALLDKNVKIVKNYRVSQIEIDEKSVWSIHANENIATSFFGKNVILAIPPKPILSILKNSKLDSVFDDDFENFVNENSYIEDIGITFHWKDDIKLPKVYGFPKTDWYIGYIINSDYISDIEPNSKTLISVVILNTNSKSSNTNKTANETEDKDELIQESLRQLRYSFPDLPNPDFSILNPRIYRDNNTWVSKDSAYFKSYSKKKFIDFQSKKFTNLYNLGTQNGNSYYVFTSMESATTNAMVLANKFINQKVNIKKLLELKDMIVIIFVLIIFLIIIYLNLKKIKKTNTNS